MLAHAATRTRAILRPTCRCATVAGWPYCGKHQRFRGVDLMAKLSAGLVMFRRTPGGIEVFLAHPGGPYFANKDDGVWTIPKGEPDPGEALLPCARREFEEETGLAADAEEYIALGQVTQANGKVVHAWAFEGEWGERDLRCNTVEMEWPPRSGRKLTFPEIDRASFFTIDAARRKLIPAQAALLDRLIAKLAARG
jgi:predicted NUDIX family NTP pyrophosphohydrolase